MVSRFLICNENKVLILCNINLKWEGSNRGVDGNGNGNVERAKGEGRRAKGEGRRAKGEERRALCRIDGKSVFLNYFLLAYFIRIRNCSSVSEIVWERVKRE